MFLIINRKSILLFILILIFVFCASFFILSFASNEVENIDLMKEIEEKYHGQKVAFITFDDGPSSKITPRILEVLKKYDIEATFFVLGKMVDENQDILKMIYDNGHFIGNHGFSHNIKSLYSSETAFKEELKKTENSIKNALGDQNFNCALFRFPNGFSSSIYKSQKNICAKSLSTLGYKYIDWNSLTNDSVQKLSRENSFDIFKKTSKDKDVLVILMHDSGDLNKTYDVLEDMIKYLLEKDYEFKSLEEFFDWHFSYLLVLYFCKIRR